MCINSELPSWTNPNDNWCCKNRHRVTMVFRFMCYFLPCLLVSMWVPVSLYPTPNCAMTRKWPKYKCCQIHNLWLLESYFQNFHRNHAIIMKVRFLWPLFYRVTQSLRTWNKANHKIIGAKFCSERYINRQWWDMVHHFAAKDKI